MTEKNENNIVVNESKAYGYNYASLSDIAKQGFKIPKMKTGSENGKDYVYYYDTELKEWIRGAEIVIPEMKGANICQKMGSALTYARRYTCHLYLSLCCDDDKKVETQSPSGLFDENMSIPELVKRFNELYTDEEKTRILNGMKVNKVELLGLANLQKYVRFKEQNAG